MKEKISNLPSSPGVYLMKDSLGGIIYVGKSKTLKKRVQSYFHNSKSHPPKVKKLVKHIKDLDHILTDTEFEAFMLECKLIQELKPMYNRRMKNPLAYTYIVIPQTEGLHRIEITNNPHAHDSHLHFGPYAANKNAVEKAVQRIQESFRIACNHPNSGGTACLNYSLGLCLGMCLGGEAIKEYNQVMERLISLLGGKDQSLYEELERRMLEASEQYDFETAAKYRDDLDAVNFLLYKQKVIGFTQENQNIVIVESLSENTEKLFFIQRNNIIYSEKYTVDRTGIETLCEEIKAKIVNHFKTDRAPVSIQVRRDEIDEAQIIYSYLQSSDCNYILIPEEWLESEDHTLMDKALHDLFSIAD